MNKSSITLLIKYAISIGKKRGFGKGRFFFLKSLVFPKIAVNWINFADNFFKSLSFREAPWDIVATPLRSCFSLNLTAQQRCEMMRYHCEILAHKFTTNFLQKLFLNQEITLSSLVGKDGSEYDLRICYNPTWRREGLVTILFYDKNFVLEKDENDEDYEDENDDEENKGLSLATISFLLFKDKNKKTSLLIGGLQGIRNIGEEGKSLVVKSTRNLQGLRPKYAVLSCAYAFASCFDISEIIAVSSNNHPVRLTNKRRNRQFHADYDEFWIENGGELREDGNFNLPLIQPKRTLEEVPAKKRKDWLARQAHLTLLNEATKNSLDSNFLSQQHQ